MKRILTFALLLTMSLGILAPSLAGAQTGTPAPGESASAGIPLGTPVPYVSSDGSVLGTITIDALTDSFTAYDPYSAPDRGYRYVLVGATVTNTGTQPFPFDPYYLQAVDSEGFYTTSPYVTFTDPNLTPLAYTEAVAPGATISGVVALPVFATSSVERIVFWPSWDRLITVLDLRPQPAVAGTPVSVIDSTGAAVAQVTVDSVTMPFTGYDASSAPPRGTNYVAAIITVTNTGSGVFSLNPSDVQIVDVDGFVSDPAYVSRSDLTIPDLSYTDLEPGASVQGMLVYPIFAGVEPAQIIFSPGDDNLYVVADLAAGMGSTTVTAPPTAVATESAVVAAATETPGAVASNPDCAGLIEWGLALSDRVQQANTLVQPLQADDLSTIDPVTLRDIAAQLRVYGDEQAASNPPAAAVELNRVMTEEFYYKLADAVDAIAGGIEQNNMTAILVGKKAAEDVVAAFAEEDGAFATAAAALETACPAELDRLDQMG